MIYYWTIVYNPLHNYVSEDTLLKHANFECVMYKCLKWPPIFFL